MTIQVVIPMSGQGTRYQKAGYTQPKPLIPVNGIPMIERLLEKFPLEWPCTFVMSERHAQTDIQPVLKKLRPQGKVLTVPYHGKGPSYALKAALTELNPVDPILVSYCDYGMQWDPWDFKKFVEETACDAALISYRGFHAHYLSPVTYAYSRMENGFVKEVKEKGSFTDNRENEFASAGAYYFRNLETLQKALDYQEKNNLSMNGEFYTSLTVEALLRMNPTAKVKVYEIPAFFQWGTPLDLQIFEYWEKTYSAFLKTESLHDQENLQVLMPMAGLGSRFKEFFDRPKPFLKIDSVPMYRKALHSLPRGAKNHYVTIQSAKEFLNLENNETALFLEKTPEGQALSVEAGLALLNPDQEIIVSACDHGIVLSFETWKSFRQLANKPDAAIFTVTGFPGAQRRPQAFAYVKTAKAEMFADVQGVSVKTPISENPSQDPLLVGSFWFKNKSVLEKGIQLLKKKDQRVNGELYLDSVFDLLLAEGFKVKTIPLEGYINWGDPDSLAEALYWSEVFCGHKNSVRPRFSGVTE